MKDELLDLAKQARERKIVYSDNNEKDIAVCNELEIMARVAEKKSLAVKERLKWWKNNIAYKAPEQLPEVLAAMFKEFLE